MNLADAFGSFELVTTRQMKLRLAVYLFLNSGTLRRAFALDWGCAKDLSFIYFGVIVAAYALSPNFDLSVD